MNCSGTRRHTGRGIPEAEKVADQQAVKAARVVARAAKAAPMVAEVAA
jgi:hypothetical protein